jgi:biopolymer transport protein ExbD
MSAKSRRRYAAPIAEPRLMSDLNTTPLIDVMLVLLIMMILSVPMITHKVAITLPQAGPADGTPPPVHNIVLDKAGGLQWDGAAIAETALPARLAAMKAEARPAELHIRADAAAPYDAFDRTVAAVKRAGIERIGLVDNARYAKSF